MAGRDFQRQRVYRAEQAANLGGELFTNIADAQVYADAVCESENVPHIPVELGRSDDSSMYSPAARRIRMARGQGFLEWVLIHELAHYLEHVRQGDRKGDHGPTFCGTYLRLVEMNLGETEAMLLRQMFKAHGVYVIGTERIAEEQVACWSQSRTLTFAEVKTGGKYAIDGTFLRDSQRDTWNGLEVKVTKKNRTKVVVEYTHPLSGILAQQAIEPALLRTI